MEPTQLQCSQRNKYKKREEKAMHNVHARERGARTDVPTLLACFQLSREAAAARALARAAAASSAAAVQRSIRRRRTWAGAGVGPSAVTVHARK